MLKSKLNSGLALVLVGCMSLIGTAHAALPAAATTAFTDMEADFEALFALAFPVLVVVAVAMIAWRYTRKLANKL